MIQDVIQIRSQRVLHGYGFSPEIETMGANAPARYSRVKSEFMAQYNIGGSGSPSPGGQHAGARGDQSRVT